ncbi:MAG: hypothetical protein GY943_22975 [Chloroflexi bacterium]|nr:hypothetical protein [Chloroflexota bacterium]
MKKSVTFPTWFTALTAMFFLMNLLVFGALTLFSPHTTFPGSGDGAIFPIQFLAARHIGMAIPLLHGLIRKDVKILKTMYTIFIIMSIIDIALLAIYGYNIPIVGLIPFVGNLPTIGKVILGILMFWVPIGASLKYLSSQSE